jgi:uncharacterized protein (TIGR03435 family)
MSDSLTSLTGSLRPLLAALVLVSCPARVPLLAAQSATQAPAQDPATQPAAPQFDVAAIHQNVTDQSGRSHIYSSPWDGQFRTVNLSLRSLMQWAFETPETRILGGPAWVDTANWDIHAKADPSLDAQLKPLTSDAGRQLKEEMVQSLLMDRFKLILHNETRELPIYNLVVAKGGPKLGATQADGTTVNRGRDHIEVQASDSIAVLAQELSKVVGRDVIDNTGITGRYDLKLKWTPDDSSVPQSPGGAPADSGPSIFTAVEEQLGLKLESAKGPVHVLVIDHAEMPTVN